jgi:hypothetical protein
VLKSNKRLWQHRSVATRGWARRACGWAWQACPWVFFFVFLFDLWKQAFEPPRERSIHRDLLTEAVVMPTSVNPFRSSSKKICSSVCSWWIFHLKLFTVLNSVWSSQILKFIFFEFYKWPQMENDQKQSCRSRWDLLPSSQIISRFDFFRYISFAMYLDITYV